MRFGPFAAGVERVQIRPWVFFEERVVGVGASWPLDWYVQVELPDELADALVVVWPGRVAPGGRVDALRRLARRAPAD